MWLRSFQSQLFIILLAIAAILILTVFFGQQTTLTAASRQATIYLIGQQRANALLLDANLDSLGRNITATERESLRQLIQTTIANFEAGQMALRQGDAALNIIPIENPIFVSVLDEMDRRWASFKATVEQASQLEGSAVTDLDTQVDRQSLAVYTFADQLAKAIDTLARQEIAAFQQALVIVGLLSVVFIGIVVVISTNLVRSINRLISTTTAFAQGNLKVRANTDSFNEIAAVGQSFNDMADQLEYLVEQMSGQLLETMTAREQAERADKVKSAFLASMSHELRTPLNSIINFTRFVADGDTGPVNEQQKELLTEVVGSGKHLLNLINDVLDMSKIDAGSLKLFVEDNVNVNTLIQNALKTAESLLIGKPVRLQTDIQPDLPIMRGDKQRVTQILLNILSNACKFTEEGFIRVVAAQADDEIYIAISDTGPGIAPEDRALVFEAFKQTHTGLRQAGGTGLGMPITKSLAEAHGGKLWLESDFGKGSTFYLTLPIKSEALVPLMA